MDRSHLLVFAAAYFAVLVLPGPGVTAVVSRVLSRGMAGTPSFIGGFVAGSLIWFTIAATGLAVIASTFAVVFVAIRWAGAAYLLYLSWKLWSAPARAVGGEPEAPERATRLFLTGMAINLGNPKVIVFFLALLPSVVEVATLTFSGFLELAGTIAAVAGGVLTAYALAASRARRLFTSARAVRLINRGSGAVMAGAAVSIVAR